MEQSDSPQPVRQTQSETQPVQTATPAAAQRNPTLILAEQNALLQNIIDQQREMIQRLTEQNNLTQHQLAQRQDGLNSVVVDDVRWGFWSMVWFIIKWVLASIPAMILLGILGAIIFAILAALGVAAGNLFWFQ